MWFNIAYHGPAYRAAIDRTFHKGLLPAIQYASNLTAGPICISDKIDMPYIYVLFEERPDPSKVVSTIQYEHPVNDMFPVRTVTRYTFGTKNCHPETMPVYVLTSDELPPHFGQRYRYELFDNYVVYYPKP